MEERYLTPHWRPPTSQGRLERTSVLLKLFLATDITLIMAAKRFGWWRVTQTNSIIHAPTTKLIFLYLLLMMVLLMGGALDFALDFLPLVLTALLRVEEFFPLDRSFSSRRTWSITCTKMPGHRNFVKVATVSRILTSARKVCLHVHINKPSSLEQIQDQKIREWETNEKSTAK